MAVAVGTEHGYEYTAVLCSTLQHSVPRATVSTDTALRIRERFRNSRADSAALRTRTQLVRVLLGGSSVFATLPQYLTPHPTTGIGPVRSQGGLSLIGPKRSTSTTPRSQSTAMDSADMLLPKDVREICRQHRK